MRWNLLIGLATTLLLASTATATPPLEQPTTVRPMAIVALDLTFDDDPIVFADDPSYARSREILTRHHRWAKNFQSFAMRHPRLPAPTELTIVDPAQLQFQAEATSDDVMIVSQREPRPADHSCSCTCSQ